jgi:hypothetical protein
VDEDGRTAFLARNRIDGRDALVAGGQNLTGKNKSGGDVELRRFWARASLLWLLRGCNGHLTCWVSGVDNTELDNGQPVRSRRHEYGCGRRWRSDVIASYGRDTDDEVQRSKELIVMGRRMRKLSVQHSTLVIATKRSLAKSFDRSWVYFLARF